MTEVPLPFATRRLRSALLEFHCALLESLWQCMTGVALPKAPSHCGTAWQESHCPLPSAQ